MVPAVGGAGARHRVHESRLLLLAGHGVPADKAEALRLFRLAVEQGEPKAADELERLGEPSPNGRSVRRGIRFVDETEAGGISAWWALAGSRRRCLAMMSRSGASCWRSEVQGVRRGGA